MVPDQDINRWGGKKQYFNTENDLVDGAMPQWGETMAPSLNWPLAFINNYLLANATATMLCPAFHGERPAHLHLAPAHLPRPVHISLPSASTV